VGGGKGEKNEMPKPRNCRDQGSFPKIREKEVSMLLC